MVQSEATTGELIAGLDDADVLAIVGPAKYRHFWTVCKDSEDCIQDLCKREKSEAIKAQTKRIENLRLLLSGEAQLEGLKTRLSQEIGRYLSLENHHGMWAEWYEANGYSEEKIKEAKDRTARAKSVRIGLEKVLHGEDE